MVDWQWRSFASLTPHELYAVIAARIAVFVVEQDCPYQDLDGLDVDAMHLIGWDGDVVAAYVRALSPGVKYAEPSIGRVITAKTHRGGGAGRQVMSLAIAYLDQKFPGQGIRISAQAHLERFYSELGFAPGVYPRMIQYDQ